MSHPRTRARAWNRPCHAASASLAAGRTLLPNAPTSAPLYLRSFDDRSFAARLSRVPLNFGDGPRWPSGHLLVLIVAYGADILGEVVAPQVTGLFHPPGQSSGNPRTR